MKADIMSVLPNRTQTAQAIKRPECTKTTKDRSFQRVLQEESGRRKSDATATPEDKKVAEETQIESDTNTAQTDVKNPPITESCTETEPTEETAAQSEPDKAAAVLMELAVGAETIVLPVNVDQKVDLVQETSSLTNSETAGETHPGMAQAEIQSDLAAHQMVSAYDPQAEAQVPGTAFLTLPEQKIMDSSMPQMQTSPQITDPAVQPVADALNNVAAGTVVSAESSEEPAPVLRAGDVKTEQAQLSLRAAGTVVQSQETSDSASGEQGESGSQSKSDKVKSLLDFESRKWSGQKLVSPAAAATDEVSAAREVRSDSSMLVQRTEGLPYTAAAEQTAKADLQAVAPEVDTSDFMEQIVRKAELMVKQNSSQVKIELQPEFLGKLTIKVVMEEGAVTAKFITDNHQVKQMLESNINLLKQSLEAQGMRVERTEVNVQLNNGGLFDGSEGNRQWMWNQQNQHHDSGASLAETEVYEYGQMHQDAESYTSSYGIQANGSMNFLV